MTYIPTKDGFMRVEDSERLLRAIFPNYPSLEPCYPCPPLEAIAPESAARDTSQVSHHCRNLPYVHVARKVKTSRLASRCCVRRKTAATQTGYFSANHSLRIRVRKPLHV